MSYFELITEQTQQRGEGRTCYFGPSWLGQCLSIVLRLFGSSCPVQAPPVCRLQGGMNSVRHAVRCHPWLATAALIKLEVFTSQVSLSCAWVMLHSWHGGTALSICLRRKKKYTHTPKKPYGKIVPLNVIFKSLNTEDIRKTARIYYI